MSSQDTRCDVLVVGGGTAGAVAAIQAARAGAHTLLIERGSMLGGTMTVGGVCYPAHFFTRERQIIAGIGWDIVAQSLALSPFTIPDYAAVSPTQWHPHLRIEPNVFACLLEEACLRAGVDLWYYRLPIRGDAAEDGWVVDVAGKGPCRQTVHCREIVDCTGDADMVHLLGFARVREAEWQPGTLLYTLQGYHADDLDPDTVEAAYRQALEEGRLQEGDLAYPQGGMMQLLRGHGMNHQHVRHADSATAANWTEANIHGRQSLLRTLRFIRSLPGADAAYIACMQPETAIRETYRIVGDVTITGEDYLAGRHFPDAIAYAYYPIDIHQMAGVSLTPLAPGVLPTIPFRALIPRGSRRVLAAGRCVSSDRTALAALRVQAPCMAMGQAAGAAAALGVRLGVPSCQVPYASLCALLEAHGAIIPRDVPAA